MLFTYTDKDGFIPHSNTGRTGHLVTGDGGRFSHLEEAVLSMPRKTTAAASSGSGRYGAGGVHGDSMGPGAAGGGVSDSASRVSDTAAVIQTHMIREDRYKVRGMPVITTDMTLCTRNIVSTQPRYTTACNCSCDENTRFP